MRAIDFLMDLVEEFFELLRQQGFEVFDDKIKGGGLSFEAFERASMSGVKLTPQRSKNVRFIRGKSGDQFLYVLGSKPTKKGFWGPDKNVIDALAKQTQPWALILLHGSTTCGYWFPCETVLSCISRSNWRLGGAGYSYKVNAPNQVELGEKFITPMKLFTLLAQLGVKA